MALRRGKGSAPQLCHPSEMLSEPQENSWTMLRAHGFTVKDLPSLRQPTNTARSSLSLHATSNCVIVESSETKCCWNHVRRWT